MIWNILKAGIVVGTSVGLGYLVKIYADEFYKKSNFPLQVIIGDRQQECWEYLSEICEEVKEYPILYFDILTENVKNTPQKLVAIFLRTHSGLNLLVKLDDLNFAIPIKLKKLFENTSCLKVSRNVKRKAFILWKFFDGHIVTNSMFDLESIIVGNTEHWIYAESIYKRAVRDTACRKTATFATHNVLYGLEIFNLIDYERDPITWTINNSYGFIKLLDPNKFMADHITMAQIIEWGPLPNQQLVFDIVHNDYVFIPHENLLAVLEEEQ